jgi:hypothetical protein
MHRAVSLGAAQGVHGHFEARIQIPGVGGIQLVLNLGLANPSLMRLNSSSNATVSATPSSTTWRTVLSGASAGSWASIPTL